MSYRAPGSAAGIASLAAALVFLVHLFGNPHYGFFRDELYFIICGRSPQWGYVDQPPLVPLLAAMTQVAGHSLLLLRIVPALFAAGGVFVSCSLAREFGGGRFAQILTALTFALTPVLLSFGMKVGTDEVGLLCWPLLTYLIVSMTRGASPRLWIAAGATAGIAFESKYSIVFFVAAILAGLLATRERRILRSGWFATGFGLALALALPNVIWQGRAGWPMLELLRAGQDGKNLIVGPLAYLAQELLITNPLLAPIWICGVVWLFRTAAFRFLGIAYVVLIAEMLAFHGKHYYPANVYPVAIAAGCVAIAEWTAAARFARPLLVVYVALVGALFVPDTLPILSEPTYVSYARARSSVLRFSFWKAIETEHGREQSALPGDFADMHGWPAMAAEVATVYDALPPQERARAVVFAGNYGEASAVAFYEPSIPVIGEHNQYWLWGPRGYSGDVMIQINGSCFASMKHFQSRVRARTLVDPYAISYEDHIPIWICRHPTESLARLWPQIKDYE